MPLKKRLQSFYSHISDVPHTSLLRKRMVQGELLPAESMERAMHPNLRLILPNIEDSAPNLNSAAFRNRRMSRRKSYIFCNYDSEVMLFFGL
ncbi:unnamed protein product [Enterobius vermicularis]|uniref:Uncharacterized protein n=1 Tax=Enterobius vermicularis TaxID=51028 RepID=A0A0N4VKV2_ENTVE|nr:unnamed protein product [Enterobius vermicularis]